MLCAMNEHEREALETARTVALRDRDELDRLIEYLSRRLGDETPVGSSTEPNAANASESLPPAPGVTPESVISPGQFFGMSATKAARAVLEKFGRDRPLKTAEIFAAISKGGVKLARQEVLYRSLGRDGDFARVARGTWGLSEWYPDRAVRRQREEAEESDAEAEPEIEFEGPEPEFEFEGPEPEPTDAGPSENPADEETLISG